MRDRPLGPFSDVQRDIIAVLAAIGKSNGYEIWRSLEEIRDRRIDDRTVYRNLDKLDVDGLVEKREINETENEYAITPEGRELLEREAKWLDGLL